MQMKDRNEQKNKFLKDLMVTQVADENQENEQNVNN